jgi:hypothetical protein
LPSTLAIPRHAAIALLEQIIAEVGISGAASCLSHPDWLVSAWLAGSAIRAHDKKAIWLIHSLMFRPEVLSSPFHIATFGRFWRHPYGDPADVTCGPEAAKHRAANYAKLAKKRIQKRDKSK